MNYVARRTTVSAPSKVKSVLLAHGDTIVRAGLRCLLDSQTSEFDVVAEAADFQEAVQRAFQYKPDQILLDFELPPLGGLEATRRLVAQFRASVLLVGGKSDGHLGPAGICAGAKGFVCKSSPVQELLAAMSCLGQDRSFVGRKFSAPMRTTRSPLPQECIITDREREVLHLLSEGCSTKEIAERLNIGARTVETHRGQITSKLNLHSTAELTKYAIRHGITSL